MMIHNKTRKLEEMNLSEFIQALELQEKRAYISSIII